MQKANEVSADGRVHFYCSSGGNAGLACAMAAITLGKPCTIAVPTLTSAYMIAKLRALGAEVQQVGAHWAAADAHLRDVLMPVAAAAGVAAVYVPPFDHPYLWAGASGIVAELPRQLRPLLGGGGGEGEGDVAPDGIVCNVGGGGLLNGIMEGVEKHIQGGGSGSGKTAATWKTAPHVLAVETVGADSLDHSVRAGELVTLPAITSIATSLGAPTVSRRTFEWATRDAPHRLTTSVVTDADAIMGSARLADDARLLVEVACGATVAPVYNGGLRRWLGKGLSDDEWARKNIVLVICGGSNISLEILKGYQEKYNVA
jgi:L-serine/L-threonine ammonia-lyase